MEDKVKKAVIICFSGTGNTLFLASLIKERLEKDDLYKTDICSIDYKKEVIELTSYDLIIFSYPIYAFNSPIIFDKYIKKLKFAKDKKYFILKQSGEPLALNNSSSLFIKRKLRKNKIKVSGEYHFLFPYNIHFRYSDEFVKELYEASLKLLDIFIYDLKNNKVSKIKFNPFIYLNALIFKIQRLGGPINSYFYKIDYNKCIHCNKCMNNCPTNNIVKINEEYKFKNKCVMCMRCSFFCPKDAINIGMLQKWKVNGAYDFRKIINDKNIKGDFLKSHKKGFYGFFKKYFKELNKKYDEYFFKK